MNSQNTSSPTDGPAGSLALDPRSASAVVATLPDGFYFFKDPDYPKLWGMIERLDGKTWRIGDALPMRDSSWDERATFFPAVLPNA